MNRWTLRNTAAQPHPTAYAQTTPSLTWKRCRPALTSSTLFQGLILLVKVCLMEAVAAGLVLRGFL